MGKVRLPAALNEVKIPFLSITAAIGAAGSNRISDWSDPLAESCQRYRDSVDFKNLFGQINEFIKVGFNRF